MTIFVEKADGRKQAFSREKVIETCLRLGASRVDAEKIADEVESKIYEGIDTQKILRIIFRRAGKYRPATKHMQDLRRSLGLMRSKPDFEQYVQLLLREEGYEVAPNTIMKGKCTEHEADAIARKDGVTYFVEAKHHTDQHTPTDLDVGRIARAVLEDVTDAYSLGISELKIDRALIVCNTRLSEQTKRYAECRNIPHIGWGYPADRDIQRIISERKLYPVTMIKGLKTDVYEKLIAAGFLTLKQLVSSNIDEVSRKTGVREVMLRQIVNDSKDILT